MRVFLIWSMMVVFALGSGCAMKNTQVYDEASIACIIIVSEDPVEYAGRYLVETMLYDENTGRVFYPPRLLVEAETLGSIIMRSGRSDADFAVQSESFGEVACKTDDDFRCLLQLERIPESGFITFKSFTLNPFKDAQFHNRMQLLDIPPVKMPLNQRVLLLRRNGATVQIPANIESAENQQTILKFSPNFPVDKCNFEIRRKAD